MESLALLDNGALGLYAHDDGGAAHIWANFNRKLIQ